MELNDLTIQTVEYLNNKYCSNFYMDCIAGQPVLVADIRMISCAVLSDVTRISEKHGAIYYVSVDDNRLYIAMHYAE